MSRRGLLVVLAGVLLFAAGCRRDMQDQPKVKPLAMSDFFADQRGSRPLIEGTIARGHLREDTYFYTGRIGNDNGDYMPFPVTEDVLARGRQRYDVFCSPCHGRVGDGNGMIVLRGYKRPPSYHIDRLREAPIGYLFDVTTNGFGAMPDYASQIPVRDRWAIAAYIRALQLSQNAQPGDLPPGTQVTDRLESTVPATGTPGSGATLPPRRVPATPTGGAQ